MTKLCPGLLLTDSAQQNSAYNATASFKRTRRHRKIVVRLLKSVANLQARIFELQAEKRSLEYIVSEQAKHIEALQKT
jgi:hypothetical protein